MKDIFDRLDWKKLFLEIARVVVAAVSGALAGGCIGFPFVRF